MDASIARVIGDCRRHVELAVTVFLVNTVNIALDQAHFFHLVFSLEQRRKFIHKKQGNPLIFLLLHQRIRTDGGMGMKKYVTLYAFTAAAVALILIAGHSVESSMVRVTAMRIAQSTVEDTITCAGKVEDYPGNSLYAPQAGIVSKLYVKVGDTVSVGQAIMDITPNNASASSSSSDSSSSTAAADYSAAYEAYSKYLQEYQSGGASSGDTGSSSSADHSQVSSNSAGVYTLKAVNAGTVKSLAVSSVGALISPSSPAVVIKNGNGMQVQLSVDESQISDLKTGQKVQVSGVGFKNSLYSGSILSVSNEAKQTLLTTGQETVVDVVASVDNPGADIKPGFSAEVKITTSQNNRVLCVPYEAVREDSNESEYVFCEVGGKAKKVPIVTGREFDTGFEVKTGIKAGDIIITDPDDVSDGKKVVIVKMAAGGNT